MSAFPTHAMLLAAGYGKRLKPLTDTIPKPMVEVAGRSLIKHCLAHIKQGGVGHAVVNASYRADQLIAHLKGEQDIAITFSREETPLETGGGIKKALAYLGVEPFFALNSDVITLSSTQQHCFKRLHAMWDENTDIVLLLHPRDRAYGYKGEGDFIVEDNQFRRRGCAAEAPYVFTGVQLLHPRIFQGCDKEAFSMNVIYDHYIKEDGFFDPQKCKYVVHDGDWLHVGDLEGVAQARAFFAPGHGDGCSKKILESMV